MTHESTLCVPDTQNMLLLPLLPLLQSPAIQMPHLFGLFPKLYILLISNQARLPSVPWQG